jgi:hypothetical protein
LCQTLDVFLTSRGPEAAMEAAHQRSGRWFDPDLVKAAGSLFKEGVLWAGLDSKDLLENIAALEPKERRLIADDQDD